MNTIFYLKKKEEKKEENIILNNKIINTLELNEMKYQPEFSGKMKVYYLFIYFFFFW